MYVLLFPDHQKLEREARICRLLKHSNIGKYCLVKIEMEKRGMGWDGVHGKRQDCLYFLTWETLKCVNFNSHNSAKSMPLKVAK